MCPEETASCKPLTHTPIRIDEVISAVGWAIVQEARSWVGTPFHHQAAVKGLGCDCAGLVRGVGVACGVVDLPDHVWAPHANYARIPRPEIMERGMRAFLIEIPLDKVRVGDVIWMQWRKDLPMHVGIVAVHLGRVTLIHSTSEVGKVVEHGLTAEWCTRVASAWRFPGVQEVYDVT